MAETITKRGLNLQEAMAYVDVKRRAWDTDWAPHLNALLDGNRKIWDRLEIDALKGLRSKTRVERAPKTQRDRTQLYRHFDSAGRLLYVGISLSALTRLARHTHGSVWIEAISTVTMEWFETREAALAAETKAIQTERPLHNISKVAKTPGATNG